MTKYDRPEKDGWERVGIDEPFDCVETAQETARRHHERSKHLHSRREATGFETMMSAYRAEMRRLQRAERPWAFRWNWRSWRDDVQGPSPARNLFTHPDIPQADDTRDKRAPEAAMLVWPVPGTGLRDGRTDAASGVGPSPSPGRHAGASERPVVKPGRAPGFGGIARLALLVVLTAAAIPAGAFTLAIASGAAAVGYTIVVRSGELDAAEETILETFDCAESTVFLAQGDFLVRPTLPEDACLHPSRGRVTDPEPDKRAFLSLPYESEEGAFRVADDVASIEGKYRVADTIFGIDPVQMIKNLGKFALNEIGFEMKYGFSGPILSGAEFALRKNESMGYAGKVFTLALAMRFTHNHLGTDIARARFINATLPPILDRGDHLSGALVDRAWFGDDPTLVERCVRASAVRYGVRPVGDEPANSVDIATWVDATGQRAVRCIEHRAQTESERAEARARLDAFCPRDVCAKPSKDRTPDETARIAQAYAAFGPARSISDTPLRSAATALEDARKLLNLPAGKNLATTIDPQIQDATKAAASEMLSRISDGHEAPIWLTLAAFDLSKPRISLAGVSTNMPTGAVTRPPVSGSDGEFSPGHPSLAQGSINKPAIALFAHAKGIHEACPEVGPCHPLRSAIGESVTEPFYPLAADLGPLGFEAFRKAIGYTTSGDLDPAHDGAKDAVHGSVVRASPVQIIGLLGALEHGRFDGAEIIEGEVVGKPFDLEALGIDARARSRTLDDLAAAFEPSGTLYSMRGAVPSRTCLPYGKTGTHNQFEKLFEKGSASVFRCGSRTIGVYAFASAPPGQVLPSDLAHAQFVPAISAIAKAAFQSLGQE